MSTEKFTEKRVKVKLHDATLLRRGDERRHNFRLSINLSEEGALIGLPEWVQNIYSLMQKAENRADDTKSKTVLENMSLGCWLTEKTRSKFFSQIMGATLSKFSLVRDGKGDEADILLYFNAHFPGRKEVHEWTYDHKNADFWMDFEPMQGDLYVSEEDATEEEEVAQ